MQLDRSGNCGNVVSGSPYGREFRNTYRRAGQHRESEFVAFVRACLIESFQSLAHEGNDRPRRRIAIEAVAGAPVGHPGGQAVPVVRCSENAKESGLHGCLGEPRRQMLPAVGLGGVMPVPLPLATSVPRPGVGRTLR